MRIQLWSYNYDPEPTGIGPVSTVWATEMANRGHEVDVVAAHPHYPTPEWGRATRPYREVRDGVSILRLPLHVGRASARARLRQELSFAAAQTVATPFLSTPDIIVAVSPSFPALGPALANARFRRVPWVLWLQDILPDGAVTTGMLEPGRALRAAQRFEALAYRSATRIVVISEGFEANLLAKGVPREKLRRVYNPSTRHAHHDFLSLSKLNREPRVLCMGNIGHSQGLVEVVEAWEDAAIDAHQPQLVIVGAGVAAGEVAAQIRTDRVQMLGLLSNEDLEIELRRASAAVVTQRADVLEFNVPSKLMNFMAYGLPVLAAVRPGSEVSRIVERADCGWISDSSDPPTLPAMANRALGDQGALRERGANGKRFADEHFAPSSTADAWEEVLFEALERGRAAA